MNSSRRIVILALGTVVVCAVISQTVGFLKITHGSYGGGHNRTFFFLFLGTFTCLYIPVSLVCRFRSRLGSALSVALHLLIGAAVGYVASLLAYFLLVLVEHHSETQSFDLATAGYFAVAFVLQVKGWVFGLLCFLILDVATGLISDRVRIAENA